MDLEAWMAELQRLGALLSMHGRALPSPWVGYTIGQALVEDDFWIDRVAAGYSPEQGLAEAVRDGKLEIGESD